MEELVYESSSTKVYRGRFEQRAAIYKMLKEDARSPTSIARYQREFELNRSLTSQQICQALDYDEHTHTIIFEDLGGFSLREYLRQFDLTLDERITLGRDIARALQSIHDEGVIHRDINPGNILVIPAPSGQDSDADLEVRLIDFGLATLTPQALPQFEQSTSLTGTLPYISPEQTGRVNRVIDYRADLYSLGVTLFELFSARLPFTQQDPLELIHAHIASTAPNLSELAPHAPEWLGEMIAKLLAKQPESRYQSAASIADDIDTALRQGNVVPFRLGRTDRPGQLVWPKKLYGRGRDLATLTDFFERARQGETLFANVSAPLGLGKTALCEQLLLQAAGTRALTATLHASTIDFTDTDTLWIEALKPIIRQILSLPDDHSNQLIASLEQHSNKHTSCLLPLIPELDTLVPEVYGSPGLPRKGINTILESITGHSLVIVLEDADCIPQECLEAFNELALNHNNILVVGTWEEFDETLFVSPRIATKSTLLELTTLTKGDLRELLGDMLSHSESRVRELASQVHTKTDGIPSLVHALIAELHSAEHLSWDRLSGLWTWDIDEVRRFFFNGNSDDRIAKLIDELPPECTEPLCVAACYGETFEVDLIATTLQQTATNAAQRLRPAVHIGILTRVADTGYRFTHHRIRASLYERIPEADKQRLHQMLAQAIPSTADTAIAVAHHLNMATDPILAG